MITVTTDVEMTSLDNLIKAAGPAANVGIARALNRVGAPVQTAYLREVRKILGIRKHPLAKGNVTQMTKRGTSTRKASPANLEYSLVGIGNGLNLIWYQPKETPAGLNVHWLGARKVVPRTFLYGGRFPKRHGGLAKEKGVAFLRTGGARSDITAKARGPGFAQGMVQPDAMSVWTSRAKARLAPEMAQQLMAILMGYAPKQFLTRAGHAGFLAKHGIEPP
jgi:hypothetical protein